MKSPILFLIFNRPDTTRQVFETIREAKPPRLYIAADGPRKNREGEKERCEDTRKIALNVDWECDVKTLFREENLGCGKAVSEAITWFFDNESEGIILEDDILAHQDFFPYCDEMLEKYRNKDNIGLIAGHNNIYEDLTKDASYGFISVPHIWGWATWRKEWNNYKYNVNEISLSGLCHSLAELGYDGKEINYWKEKYSIMKHFLIDTWDYQWVMSILYHRKLSVTPYKSLTKNIGFTQDATHTNNASRKELSLVPSPIYPITHPVEIRIDKEAEYIELVKSNRYRTKKTHIIFNMILFIKLLLKRNR